jgi:hypothetical protein
MVVNRVGVAGVAGVVGVLAVFAAGAWLVTAPFALGYQAAGVGWTGGTKTDVIIGAVLAAVGFAGLVAVIAGRVGELYAEARSAASLADTADRGISGS